MQAKWSYTTIQSTAARNTFHYRSLPLNLAMRIPSIKLQHYTSAKQLSLYEQLKFKPAFPIKVSTCTRKTVQAIGNH